jgi:hypothetical protein
MRKVPAIVQPHRSQPDLGSSGISFYVDVHWLGTVSGVEEEAVGAAAENGRHGDSEMGCGQSNGPAKSPIIEALPSGADCRGKSAGHVPTFSPVSSSDGNRRSFVRGAATMAAP